MKKIIISLMFVFVSSSVFAYDYKNNWSIQDTILQSSLVTLLYIDCQQTKWISKTKGHKEANPFLGENPSNKKINLYFISYGILHTGVSYILPSVIRIKNQSFYLRTIWQSIYIGMELNATIYNYKAGVKFNF